MEQLRRIMEERKAKRRARREARASPYSTSWSLKSSDEVAAASEAASVVSGAEAAAGGLQKTAHLHRGPVGDVWPPGLRHLDRDSPQDQRRARIGSRISGRVVP